MRDIALFLSVLGAHVAPGILAKAFADPVVAYRWLFYILRSIEPIVISLVVLRKAEVGTLGRAACIWAIAEEAQVAGCGALEFANPARVPIDSGLCVVLVGREPYAVLVAACLVAVFGRHEWMTRAWRWLVASVRAR